jgi:hypothetical protein
MPKKRPTGVGIRQVTLRDLSSPSEVVELNRMLRELTQASRRTTMNVETPANRGGDVDERRIRVVESSSAVPGDDDFGENEYHVHTGKGWKKIKLEAL